MRVRMIENGPETRSLRAGTNCPVRTRLRGAALRLRTDNAKVPDIAIALDCGFGDVSSFNRAFRAEFGQTPARTAPEAES